MSAVIIHPSCTNRLCVKYIQARTRRLAVVRNGYLELIEDPHFHDRLAEKLIDREMRK